MMSVAMLWLLAQPLMLQTAFSGGTFSWVVGQSASETLTIGSVDCTASATQLALPAGLSEEQNESCGGMVQERSEP